jgi:hypothetical protein
MTVGCSGKVCSHPLAEALQAGTKRSGCLSKDSLIFLKNVVMFLEKHSDLFKKHSDVFRKT